VALTNLDRDLLKRCLSHQPGAWNDFVDRYLGLIYHVVHHTAHLRSTPLKPEDVEDVAAQVLLQIVDSDYSVLKQFKGQSSLATYLTVVARRICVHELARRTSARDVQPAGGLEDEDEVDTMPAPRPGQGARRPAEERPAPDIGGTLEQHEEVEKLLGKLPSREREVVRLHYIEGRTYEEISTALNIPVNSIGPILSRARKKLRQAPADETEGERPGRRPSAPNAGRTQPSDT
jgi:RNA polymerase sigma-70 factor (ECF subfamily)